MEDQPLEPRHKSVEVDFSGILGRLHGARRFRQALNPNTPDFIRREDDISEQATKFARSEEFVESNELPNLNRRIDQARRQIFDQGQTIQSHPDYQTLLSRENIPQEELNNTFWIASKNWEFEVTCDKFLLDKPLSVNSRLNLTYNDVDHNRTINIEFGFNSNVRLSIEFQEAENEEQPLHYNSSNETSSIPVNRMTTEEYRVIIDTLDKYLQLLGQQTNETPK